MANSAYGKILVASELENSVKALLQKCFPAYLREIERQVGWEREPLATPRNYTSRNSFDDLSGEELPKVVVISPGLYEVPEHPEADGYYRATWQLGVGIAFAARTEELADQMVKMYGAAARGILIQNQDLGRDDVCYVTWLDESYDDLPIDDQIQLYKAAAIFCGVEVETAVNRFMGPATCEEVPELIGEFDTVITTIPEWDKTVTRP